MRHMYLYVKRPPKHFLFIDFIKKIHSFRVIRDARLFESENRLSRGKKWKFSKIDFFGVYLMWNRQKNTSCYLSLWKKSIGFELFEIFHIFRNSLRHLQNWQKPMFKHLFWIVLTQGIQKSQLKQRPSWLLSSYFQ